MKRRTFLSAAAATVSVCAVPSASAQEFDADTEADINETVLGEIRQWGGRTLTAVGAPVQTAPTAQPTEATRALISRGSDYVVPPMTDELRQRISQNYWDGPAERIQPQWVEASRQPDYRHLAHYTAPPEAFSLDAEVLGFLSTRNAFVFRDLRPVRLFGLRGCTIADNALDTGWAASHNVRHVEPNHINFRCVMGLWRTSDNHLRLFRASTTPQASNMFKVLEMNGWGASLMPTGLYRYRLGTHNAGTPRPQAGALRNEETYVVLRTARDLVYDVYSQQDIWTEGSKHNIHAAGMDWANPRFDSSGCQVVHGKYNREDRRYTEGSWTDYRREAGLVGDDGFAAPDELTGHGTFDYMLLTGLEAALAQAGRSDFTQGYNPLRHGSRGRRVVAAQERLFAKFPRILGRPAGIADGMFGPTTAFAALSEYKENEGEYLSTVLTQ